MRTAALLLLIACSSTEPGSATVLEVDADTDADADADADADTDTGTETTGDTGVLGCEPERHVVLTAATVANPNASGFLRFSACVDPVLGEMRAIKQQWYGDINGVVECMYTWETTSTNVVTDCSDCDWAFEFNWGTPYEDGTTQCSVGWWDPIALSTPINERLGFDPMGLDGNPDVLWDNDGDGTWISDFQVYFGAAWPMGSEIDATFDGTEWLLTYQYAGNL
jgi:hypothetical protein